MEVNTKQIKPSAAQPAVDFGGYCSLNQKGFNHTIGFIRTFSRTEKSIYLKRSTLVIRSIFTTPDMTRGVTSVLEPREGERGGEWRGLVEQFSGASCP